MRKPRFVLLAASTLAILILPAQAQDFHWVQVSPANPSVWYSVSGTDTRNNTVSVMVAFMRRASNPGAPNSSGAMRTEMILCGKGYEDTHQDVKGVFHPAAESFQMFDFSKPGVMEMISRAVCKA